MKVAIYIRVSTQEQAQEGYSIQAQTERLKNYCKAKDWIVYDEYIDAAFSGAKIDRPAMQKLIHDVKSKNVDMVLVYKLDRLSRSQKDTLYLIEDVFLPNKVDFASVNENFDTSTAFGRAMIGILSVFAQLEREQIKERTSMGRKERAKEGFFHGGGFDPIGYDYIDGKLIVNEYEAMQVREIFKLFLDKIPLNRIKTLMNSKYTTKYGGWANTSSVSSCITSKIYVGKIEYLGQVYKGQHESIIDDETFESAQKRYDEISWSKNSELHKFQPFKATTLLSGLLFCGNCGARYFSKGQYSGHAPNRWYEPYYTCYSRAKTAKHMIIDPNCKNKSYMVRKLDGIVISEIKKIAFESSAFDDILKKTDSESDIESKNLVIEKKISNVDKQLERLLDLYQEGVMPISKFRSRIDILNGQKSKLVDQLKIDGDSTPALSVEDAKEKLALATQILETGAQSEKRNVIHELIKRIDIIGDGLKIHWHFSGKP